MADKGEPDVVSTTTEAVETAEKSVGERVRDTGKGILVKEDVANIMDLQPSDLNKPVEIIVYRKWASRNVPYPNPTRLCFIFLDKKGGAIQANVQLWDMRLFDAKLQVNSCYKIQGFGTKKTDKWQRTLPNRMTLLLGKYTQIHGTLFSQVSSYQQEVFTTEATIVNIDESKGWYFNRCRTCHMKIEEGHPHRHCQQMGTKPAPNYTRISLLRICIHL